MTKIDFIIILLIFTIVNNSLFIYAKKDYFHEHDSSLFYVALPLQNIQRYFYPVCCYPCFEQLYHSIVIYPFHL